MSSDVRILTAQAYYRHCGDMTTGNSTTTTFATILEINFVEIL